MTLLDFLSIFLVALSLSADCFAVSLCGAVALRRVTLAQVLRMSVAFGVFQTGMQLAGWLAGKTIVGLISGYDHWVAFGLLVFIGGRMVWESLHEENEAKEGVDITKGLALFVLSVATSIDSLAVGLSYAFISISIALPSILAGVIAFAATIAGFILGKRVSGLFGRRAETIGGLVLIGIGIRIMVEHLSG
jgi:manganese efflux pump family protein